MQVANIARGATIVSAIVELPLDMASLSLVLASGALLFVGGVRAADHANRVLTGLLLLSLGLTILTGLGHVRLPGHFLEAGDSRSWIVETTFESIGANRYRHWIHRNSAFNGFADLLQHHAYCICSDAHFIFF